MRVLLPLLVVLIVLVAWWLAGRLRRWRRAQRRERLRQGAIDAAWHEVLLRNVTVYARLPEDLRAQLHGHMRVFLDEKRFFGRGGIEMDDEIRVTIAGQACLLLLNRDATYYPGLLSIFVFPDAYTVTDVMDEDDPVVRSEVRLGESWDDGPVVLSWDAVLHGAENEYDGHNVVLHEFAHQLDQEYGATDGAPDLGDPSRYEAWARVLGAEYEKLRRQAARGRRTTLDDYGAENPAEFFAVATETFFEKPGADAAAAPGVV